MATDSGQTQTPKTFKQNLLAWSWNALNALLGGAATAGAAALAGAMSSATPFTPRQIGSVVVAGGIVALFNYVRTNRLPAMFNGDPQS